MCSIFGFYGNFETNLLSKANKILSHRGPDSNGVWFSKENKIGLAHTRLSILDLSKLGHQPMIDTNTKNVISYNGEIYNFRELKKDLITKGYKFLSNSDTEVLLKLYDCYGHELLNKLNGIFAFSIWDDKNKELFVARDQFGVKPLYYSQSSNGYIFSSELKALLLDNRVSKELDIESIYYYLSFLWSPAPSTMLKNINKLEPGYAQVIKNGKIKKQWSYYDIPFNNKLSEFNEIEYINKSQELLEQAVERQLVSDVPIGAFLSGGVDSSTIVAIARKKLQKPIDCFTIDLKGNNLNEGFEDDYPYAKKVAEILDVNLHTINVDPMTMYTHIEDLIYNLDEPQADPAPINAGLICSLAKQSGYKVLLSGAGGDDIFSGYRRHYACQLDKNIMRLPNILRQGLSNFSTLISPNTPIKRRIKKLFSNINLNGQERIASYFLWSQEKDLLSLFNDEINHKLFEGMAINKLVETLQRVPLEKSTLNQMLYIDNKHFLTDHNLNYTDKVAMAHSLEVRVPFLDIDLVNFSTTIPDQFKQKGKVSKYILKKVAEKYLPYSIIHRTKSGFGAPLRKWMKTKPFQDMMAEYLNKSSLNRRGIFNPNNVQNLIKNNQEGKVDSAYSIFSLMCIEIWCRKFLD